MSEDNDTARRVLANIIKYTLPGQLELPVNWINDDSEENVALLLNANVFDKKIGESTVADGMLEEENLEDGELLEEGEKEEEDMEKENINKVASTSFESSNESNNGGSDSSGKNKKGFKKSAKQEARRQKFGHLICKFFREGNCHQGDACCYSHDAADSHRTPELCKGYIHGTCRKMLNCPLLHGEHPCKDFVFRRCNVAKCRFSHQPLNDYTKSIFEKTLKDEEAIAAARPISPPFLSSSSGENSVNCPPKFSHQSRPFSSSTNAIRTKPNSLSSSKKSFRHSANHPYKKPNKNASKSKPLSPDPLRNVSTVENLLSEVAFNLPHLRQCC